MSAINKSQKSYKSIKTPFKSKLPPSIKKPPIKLKSAMSVKEPHIIKTETILSVAIFGHGIEQQHGLEKNDPWLEKSGNHPIPPEYRTEIPEFYKNRVRVFSYSGMPDIQCIYAEQGISLMAENLAMVLRSNPNAETKTALESYMGYCKPYYEDYLKPENVDATIVIDSKLSRSFKNKYKKKTCGTLAFLANKVFTFDSPSKGVYLLDVRLKNTFSNGTITYQSIFTPEKDRFVNLRTQEGLDLLLSLIPQSNSELFESMPMIGYGNDTVSDLIDLYRIFSLFDYVNIADYSCRTIYSKKKITGRRMAYMYSREQDAIDEMTSFGGKYKKKTQRKNRPVRKTVKSR